MRASKAVAAIAAVLLPALIFGAAWSRLARPDTGKLDERAASIREKLQAAPPDVVIVGNSLARDDIDADRLGKVVGDAGLDAPAIAKLAIGGTPPPVWYAVAKHRVYGDGFSPKLIVVPGTLTSFFWTEVSTAGEAQRLRENIGTNDAEILRKAYGRSFVWPPLERANLRRVDLRDDAVERWAEMVVDASGLRAGAEFDGDDLDVDNITADAADPRQGALAVARARIDKAFDAVFESDAAVDMTLHQRVIPVLQDRGPARHEEAARPLEQTFIPDLLALARANDARLVFVRVPLSRSRKGDDPDDRLREMITWANNNDVGFIDLSDIEVEERHFRDGEHLNKRGRRIFTDALGQALIDLGAFGSGQLVQAEVPLEEATIGRQGDPTPLAAIDLSAAVADGCVQRLPRPDLADYGVTNLNRKGLWNSTPLRFRADSQVVEPVLPGQVRESCSGFAMDGDDLLVAGFSGTIQAFFDPTVPLLTPKGTPIHWVLPGAPIVVVPGAERVDRWGAESLDIEVVAQPLGRGSAPVWLRVGEERIELGKRDGRLVSGKLKRDGLPERFTVESEEGAVLRLVRIRRGSDREDLLGEPELAGEAVVRAFDGGGSAATFQGPPPALGGYTAALVDGAGEFDVPDLRHMNTSVIARKSDKYFCSQVRVTRDGQLLDLKHDGCAKVDKPGEFCHDGSRVRFLPPTGELGDLARYGLALDPARACRSWTFVYGGDRMRIEVPGGRLRSLLAGAEELELMAIPLDREEDPRKAALWTLRLDAGDTQLVQRDFHLDDLAEGIFRAPLKRMRKPDQLVFTLEAAAEAPPLIVGYLLLRERPVAQGKKQKADAPEPEAAEAPAPAAPDAQRGSPP